jgi:mannosyltransferase OCH1-like enzyme
MLLSSSSFAFQLVDFWQSLNWQTYQSRWINQEYAHLFLRRCQQLYEKIATFKPASQSRIPKIIHQIWLGGQLPDCYRAWCASWQEKHPDWQYQLWTDDDAASYEFINKDLFESATNFGQKADIWRYEILYRYGGLYVDIDEECLKPFDELHDLCDLYIGMQSLDTAYLQLGIAVIGAAPGHPLLMQAIAELEKTAHSGPIVLKTGPLFFTRLYLQYAAQYNLHDALLPPSYFYPCGYEQKNSPQAEWQKDESYAVHHWAGSWLK